MVWRFAAEQVQDGGYETVSEYLVDLLTDAYFKQKEPE
jgi:Arc/MetJ-type ribon-helix-helix transcriptional regulator